MNDHLENLLSEASHAYSRSNAQYRDNLLCAGKWLHQFVLDFLKQADSLDEKLRIANRFSRAEALKIAAERLQVETLYVNRFIAVAMVVELLSDNGEVGDLPFGSIAYFWRFIRRQTGKRGQTGAFPGRQGVPISSLETWEIKPEFREPAIELFRLAVETNMHCNDISAKVMALYSGPTARRRSRRKLSPKEQSAVDLLLASMAKASPGDVAETCLQMIAASAEPWAVSQRLLVMVQKFKKKREPMCG
jgi:hypothetical protein